MTPVHRTPVLAGAALCCVVGRCLWQRAAARAPQLKPRSEGAAARLLRQYHP